MISCSGYNQNVYRIFFTWRLQNKEFPVRSHHLVTVEDSQARPQFPGFFPCPSHPGWGGGGLPYNSDVGNCRTF